MNAGRSWADRIVSRMARLAVERLAVPPRAAGYRFLPTRHPAEFAFREVHAATRSHGALPRNATREELSRDRGRWGFSFYEVPDRPVAATFLATVPGCRIVTARDQWGDPHYAILTGDGSVLNVRGTAWEPALHAPVLRREARRPSRRLAAGTWILELWNRNYAHWVLWHLVKVPLLALSEEHAPLLVPPLDGMAGVVGDSLSMLGLSSDRLAILEEGVVDVDSLTVTGIDSHRAELLGSLREALAGPAVTAGSRRIFLSREGATRRRLTNEDECHRLLEPLGFEWVWPEKLPFAHQVALFRDAAVVVAPHGAGLANILFSRPGTEVIEMSDVTFPNPHFYALAAELGQPYWIVPAEPAGESFRPGYHDVRADVAALARAVEGALEDGAAGFPSPQQRPR